MSAVVTPEPKGKGIEESVTVFGKPENSNPDTYVLDELNALTLQVRGKESLPEQEGVKQYAPLLFHGLLKEVVGDDRYTDIQRTYTEGAPAETRPSAERLFPSMGRAVIADRGVYENLYRPGDIVPVTNRLGYVDAPELYIDIARLQSQKASGARKAVSGTQPQDLSRLVSAVDAYREANANYADAARRYLEGRAPSSLHLNIGASAQNAIVTHDQAIALMKAAGIGGPEADEKLRAYVGVDGARAEHVLSLATRQRNAHVKTVEESYRAVINRGPRRPEPSPPKATDEHFAFYVNALARLCSFEDSRGTLRPRRRPRKHF